MKNILRNLARKLFPVKSGWTRFSRGQKSFYKGMKENKLSGENLTLKDSENNIISIDDILYDGVVIKRE